jgi:hypothetical protein
MPQGFRVAVSCREPGNIQRAVLELKMADNVLWARWGYEGGITCRVSFYTNIHGKCFFQILKKKVRSDDRFTELGMSGYILEMKERFVSNLLLRIHDPSLPDSTYDPGLMICQCGF